ncbi:VIT and VWA domain-containing protein [Thiobacillus sp. 0-1251]|uniref:VIT and vWA domain-containing protein n=1 Tax=Thiobacillus sp. 0-1251 TaxID=1895858 RepID=UPI0009609A84|nr:VIT and VWA domain-containing protein [Thiobacillus sp. 0-1251]OJY56621.1 MAG: hypothetical protein BGP19_04540 [Thiobacillus sp. 0-1251]
MGNELAIMKTLAGEKMPLLGVTARGVISGELFELEVEQRYRNEEDKNIEAIYTFPLAARAVLLDIEFELGGKKLSGIAVERKEAEQEYEKAIEDGNTAILLEKSSEDLYTVNLGNLMAGEEAVVRYRYAEPLVREQGRLRLVIPTAIAPRYGNPESAGLKPHQIPGVDIGVSYPFTLALDVLGELAKGDMSSPSHNLTMAAIEHGIRLNLKKGWLDRDFILMMDGAGYSNISCVRDDEQWVAMATFCPAIPDVYTDRPLSLRLVIDCSGSMEGDSITQARQAAIKVIETLKADDEFDVTLFGSNYRLLFGHMMPSDDFHKGRATQELIGLEADMGGTEMEDALRATTTRPSERGGGDVLLITDGEIWRIGSLIAMAQKSHLRYFIVGVGSSPSHATLRTLAEETKGAYEAVSPNEDIESVVLRQFARMRQPRATRPQVAWPVPPLWTTQLPKAIFHDGTFHVYAGFSQPLAGDIKLTYSLDEERDAQEVAHVSPWEGKPASLARIAIAKRIQEMSSPLYGREPGSDRPMRMTKGRLAKLAVQYNLATAYTHYLIVHERADGEKAENLPDVRQVKQMLAAGWGGSGTVMARLGAKHAAMMRPQPCQQPIIRVGCDDALFFDDEMPTDEVPSVMTSRREETKQAMDDGGTDIPAFLKKQPGDKKATKHEHLNLKDLLKKLIELVNSGLTHPDDFPALANKLNNVPELILLQDFINTIKNQGMRTDEIWVALISWAAKQAGSEYQLTRHAARSIHSLSGAIAPDRFAELMMKLNSIALL